MIAFERADVHLLQQRAQRIITRLKMISDAPMPAPPSERTRYVGRSTIASVPGGHSEPPRGARMDERANHCPSKQQSLYAHFLWRMQRAIARDDWADLSCLCSMAERDFLEYVGLWQRSRHGTHTEQVNELLRDWRGVASSEVAYWLGQPERWVRRQRVLNGVDAEFGESAHRDETLQRIVNLSNGGASARVIAAEVGIPKSTVIEMLAGGKCAS